PLDPGFEKIATLGNDRQGHAADHQEGGLAAEQAGRQHADEGGGQDAADQAGPGLAGADARREAGAADGAPDEVAAAVGGPDHGEQPQHQLAAPLRHAAQPQQRQAGEADIDQAEWQPGV